MLQNKPATSGARERTDGIPDPPCISPHDDHAASGRLPRRECRSLSKRRERRRLRSMARLARPGSHWSGPSTCRLASRAPITLAGGNTATVKLLAVDERRDPFRSAVREAKVKVEVNGETVTLVSGNYQLPVAAGRVQLDCPITRGYRSNSTEDLWGLITDARIRLWPAGSPWIEPTSFVYPARQRWFASMTQMANEPVYVDGGEKPGTPKIYYHNGLDIGGAEGLVEVVAATDGVVVTSGTSRLAGYEDSPVRPRYDVVYLLDDRGWYYRYSHMQTIEPAVAPGALVRMGQKIGTLGKEGGSGGWSHLHFEITSRQPSGRWGTQEGYAFLWQAYLREQEPEVLAVARPHHLVGIGEPVLLDGSKSWSRAGPIANFEWNFGDGSTATGPKVERTYARPGSYSESPQGHRPIRPGRLRFRDRASVRPLEADGAPADHPRQLCPHAKH